jgi:hypothetical protein
VRLPAILFLRLGLAAVLSLFGNAMAQETQPTESRVKAAFIYNFAKFIEWPADAFTDKSSPLVIGVLAENNSFAADLQQTVQGKTANNRPLIIKEFRSVAEATNCHILFISASVKKPTSEILSGVRGTNVLTVGETERFTENGGMINFVLEDNKVRFQINDETAKKAGLKISSKLLSLAVRPSR